MTKPNFEMETALKQLREGEDLTDKDGILTPSIKQPTEVAMMQAALDEHLKNKVQSNRKNGSTFKTVKALPESLNSALRVIALAPLTHSW